MTVPSPSFGPASGRRSGRELRADRFHAGVRFGAIALWLVLVIAGYGVSQYLLRLIVGEVIGGGLLLLMAAMLFISQPLARWGEQQLIRLWPSGRAVQLEPEALTMREKSGPIRFDLSASRMNYWRWHFAVRNRRGGRVSTGDHVFAVRLVQGEQVVSLYAFVPKKNVESVLARYAFYELQRPSDPTKLPLGGRDAVYLAAEHARWECGAELDPADFDALLAHMSAYLPDFKASPSS